MKRGQSSPERQRAAQPAVRQGGESSGRRAANGAQTLNAAATWLERWFLRSVLGLSLTAWLSLVLAELGLFSLHLLGLLLTLGAMGGGLLLHAFRGGPASPRPVLPRWRRWRPAAAFGAATLLAAALSFPPWETVLQGGDASVYLNVGRQIARTGALEFDDALVRDLPLATRAALFGNRVPGDATGRYARFPGGLLIPDVAAPRVTAGFSPLLPVLTAVGHALASLPGALAVAPLFATLSVGGLCLVATRVGGTRAGWLAATLAAVSLPQLWFAKMPVPEMVAQCFLMTGLLALLVALRADAARWAAAAGWLLGVAGLAKVDLVVLVGVALLAFAAWWLLAGPARGGRCLGWLLVSFGLPAAHAAAHFLVFASHYRPYAEDLLRESALLTPLRAAASRPAGAALLAGLAAACLLLAARGRIWRRPRACGAVLSGLVAAWAVNYAATTGMRFGETIVWLEWYLPWPVLLLAAAGLVRLIRDGRADGTRPGIVFALVLLAVVGLHYLHDPLETGVQLRSMRRFVPVVLPLLLLAAAVAAVDGVGRAARRWRPWLAAGTAAALVVLVGAPSAVVARAPLWRGAAAQLAEVARPFPDAAVVLVSPDLAGTHIPTSLAYLHGVEAVLVQDRSPDALLMEEAILRWLARGRPVFALLGPAGFTFYSPALALAEMRAARIDVLTLEQTTGRPPRAAVNHVFRMRVLRVTRRAGGARTSVDVGAPDDLFFNLRGFHAAETDRDRTRGAYRWTGPRATLTLPRGDAVTLVVAGARPAGAPPAEIAVWIDGRPVGEGLAVPDDPHAITLDVPDAARGPAIDLTIQATAFQPLALGLSADPRRLGVRVYRIDVRPDARRAP